MELSPQMAILHDTPRHLQDILHYVDSEAVVPYNKAHFAVVVRPEDVRVDPVELGVGDYDSAFQCRVWGSYDCVLKIPNNNLRADWHPKLIKRKQLGAVEYIHFRVWLPTPIRQPSVQKWRRSSAWLPACMAGWLAACLPACQHDCLSA